MKEAIDSRTVIHILLIFILGLLAYSNTFHVPFQFDDMTNIVENVKWGDFNNFWPPSGTRWFGFLTFALNYKLGGLDTTGYHIFNISIHIINAILVYYLAVLTFKTPFFSKAAQRTQNVIARNEATKQSPDFKIASPAARNDSLPTNTIALFSALLFVSHPIQTQAVTYIVQRFTSLATFFYLLSLVMYIKARLEVEVKAKVKKNSIFSASTLTFYLLSLISAILAMKTKEIAFTLPFIITLYEFMFFGNNQFVIPVKTGIQDKNEMDSCWSLSRTLIRGRNDRMESGYKRLLYLIPFLLTLLIIPLSMSGINKPLGDVIGELKEYTAETDAIDRWSYLFTQFRVIVTYLRLLFFPINQNLLYDYPVYRSFFDPNVFLSFLFLVSIFGLGVYLFYRSRLTRTRAEQAPPLQNSTRYTLHAARFLAFGIFWFFITLSVESSIIPIRHLIFEHRLYLPGIGAIMAFSAAIFYVLQFTARPASQSEAGVFRSRISASQFPLFISYFLLLITIVITLSIATYQRNSIWRDEIIIWKDVVEKSPNSANSHNGLGTAYYGRGMMDEAINEYHKALSLNPDHQDAQYNLTLVYKMKKAIDSKKKRKH